MHSLIADPVYGALYTVNEEVLAVCPAEAFHQETYGNVYAMSFPSMGEIFGLIDPAGAEGFNALSEPVKKQMNRNLPILLVTSFSNTMGINWVAAGSIYRNEECFLMPEGFEPCVLLFDSGMDVWPCVAFSEAGEGIVKATATFVSGDFFASMVEGIQQLGAEGISLMPFRFAKK